MSGDAVSKRDATPPYRFRTVIDVRFSDLDAYGHVNNAVYLTYFEIARIAYITAVRGHRFGSQDDTFAAVVAEATCRYRSAAFFGERLVVEVAPVSLRSRSFELQYRICEESSGRLVAEGHTVQVAFDLKQQRTTKLDSSFRNAVERYEGRTIVPERGASSV